MTNSLEKGVVLGSVEYLQESDPFLIPILVNFALSLPAESSTLTSGRVSQSASSVVPVTPEWAFNFANHFVNPNSCEMLQSSTEILRLEIASWNGTVIGFTWKEPVSETQDGTWFIGWIAWPHPPIYTPITLKSQTSGTTVLPRELRGLVVAVLSKGNPDNTNSLTTVISELAVMEVVT